MALQYACVKIEFKFVKIFGVETFKNGKLIEHDTKYINRNSNPNKLSLKTKDDTSYFITFSSELIDLFLFK